jgi:hypothetical protein
MARTAEPIPAVNERTSKAFEQWVSTVRERQSLSLLDLGGANQANITFITELGHRLYADDFLRSVDMAFSPGADGEQREADAENSQEFLEHNLDFPEYSFDGALLWDTLQFLSAPLLEATVERLYRVLRADAPVFLMFAGNEKAKVVPSYYYRISGPKNLTLTPRGDRVPSQFFNNRSVENLFRRWGSIKFFLNRDNVRELIVRR